MSELSPIPNLDHEPSDEKFVPTGRLGSDLAKFRAIQLRDADHPAHGDSTGIKIIPKASQSAIIPDHKQQLLRRIGNAQAEIGRLNKLLDEIRADVLHLTTD